MKRKQRAEDQLRIVEVLPEPEVVTLTRTEPQQKPQEHVVMSQPKKIKEWWSIADLAEATDRDPSVIYRWLRDHPELGYQPGRGRIHGKGLPDRSFAAIAKLNEEAPRKNMNGHAQPKRLNGETPVTATIEVDDRPQSIRFSRRALTTIKVLGITRQQLADRAIDEFIDGLARRLR
jgi:hypothetical protein